MIEEIEIHNFKSLVDFRLSGWGKFVCLIGLNGSGKTTLLQALDFLGCCFSDNTTFHDWDLTEFLSHQKKLRTCSFNVRVRLIKGGVLQWTGTFNVDHKRFTSEKVVDTETGTLLCEVKERFLSISQTQTSLEVSELKYHGSIFSFYRFDKLPELVELRDVFVSLRSFGLLSPESLRRTTRQVSAMGFGGEGLAGFLFRLPKPNQEVLQKQLQTFYPSFGSFSFVRKQAGWIHLRMQEHLAEKTQTSTEIRHINDGFLRLTAILAQQFSDDRILLFDEVENGFNQELMERLVDTILHHFKEKQVIISTHSALFLNYLPDEVARRSVFLLHRNEQGKTYGLPFFELPNAHELLTTLSPGQVMSEINLEELSTQLNARGANG